MTDLKWFFFISEVFLKFQLVHPDKCVRNLLAIPFSLAWFLVDAPINNIITARKRSLGQGNMFTGVCLSTGGCLVPGGVPDPGGCLLREGVPGQGGGCLVQGGAGRGGAWWRPPGRLQLRAIRILLECILVY